MLYLGDHAIDGIVPIREARRAKSTDLERVDDSRCQVAEDDRFPATNRFLYPRRACVAIGDGRAPHVEAARFPVAAELDFQLTRVRSLNDGIDCRQRQWLRWRF